MAESRYEHDQSGQPHPAGQLKRRGMLAGVAALVAAGLHRGTARPVAAGMDGDLTLGATNTLVSGTNNTQTTLKPAAAEFPGLIVLKVDATNDTGGGVTAIQAPGGNAGTSLIAVPGLEAFGGSGNASRPAGGAGAKVVGGSGSGPGASGPGLTDTGGGVTPGGNGSGGAGLIANGVEGLGTGQDGVGVRGNSGTAVSRPGSIGVLGVSDPNSQAVAVPLGKAGVYGLAAAIPGVRGDSASGPGVFGTSTGGLGVQGQSTNNVGVLGAATDASNASPGVFGSATQGYGVFGFSASSSGIAGQSGGQAASCVGFAGAPGGWGVCGGIAVQGGYAGGFAGPVLVVGDFTPTGGPNQPPSPIRMAPSAALLHGEPGRFCSRTSARPSWSMVEPRSSWTRTRGLWSTTTSTSSS